MIYVRLQDGIPVEYPVYEGEIRLRFPNVSFPKSFNPPSGYAAVQDTAPPQADHTQDLAEEMPVFKDGVWWRVWVLNPASPEAVSARLEQQWEVVRNIRNDRLSACDWTQLSDAPVDAAAWATYRQALRDITTQADSFNIVWPTEPV